MVEFKKTARTKGQYFWIHDGSPVYTVNEALTDWSTVEYEGTSDPPTTSLTLEGLWNPFDGKRGAGTILSVLEGAITTVGQEHYLEGTLNGAPDTKVIHFRHGRAQEGTWIQEVGDDSFVDFSTATIGCWVSEQVTFAPDGSAKTVTFKNVNLQGRYPRAGFLSLEGASGVNFPLAAGLKLGNMTVIEDSTEDDDVKVLLEPTATEGIKVTVQFGSEAKLAELLGTTASTLTHLNVIAYPRDDSDDGFGAGLKHSANAPAIETTAETEGYFEQEYAGAFAPTALTTGDEYEIRLRAGSSATALTGNEVVVGIATAGADHPNVTRVFNVTLGTKVFGVQWSITASDGSTALANNDADLTFRAIVFG